MQNVASDICEVAREKQRKLAINGAIMLLNIITESFNLQRKWVLVLVMVRLTQHRDCTDVPCFGDRNFAESSAWTNAPTTSAAGAGPTAPGDAPTVRGTTGLADWHVTDDDALKHEGKREVLRPEALLAWRVGDWSPTSSCTIRMRLTARQVAPGDIQGGWFRPRRLRLLLGS